MKTQILQLEPHDDVLSALDKMGWGQTGRIILVWPKHERVLNRQYDLVLLQRHATAQGAQLALVSWDMDVHFFAHQLKIPVFKKLQQAQSTHWRSNRKRRLPAPPATSQISVQEAIAGLRARTRPAQAVQVEPKVNRRLLLACTILFALILVILFLPGAQISIAHEDQLQAVDFIARTGPDIHSSDLSGDLLSHSNSVVVEGRQTISTTGHLYVPEKSAVGQVIFTNLTTQTVAIPAGIQISTALDPPVRFETLNAGTISAGAGQTTTLSVRALAPGPTGNVSAHSVHSIDSSLGLFASVSNPEPIQGGSSRLSRGPASADYDQISSQLLATLRQTALHELNSDLDPEGLVLTPTLTLSKTLEETFLPAPSTTIEGQPAEKLELTLRLEFSAQVIDGQQVEQIATGILDANLPSGYLPNAGALKIIRRTLPQATSSGVAQWNIHVERNLVRVIDDAQVRKLIFFKSPGAAAAGIQQQFHLQKKPQIQMIPRQWPWMPLLPFRIQILHF